MLKKRYNRTPGERLKRNALSFSTEKEERPNMAQTLPPFVANFGDKKGAKSRILQRD